MKRPTFKLFQAGHYPFDVLFVAGASDEQVQRHIEKSGYELSDEEREQLAMQGIGRTVMLEGGATVMWLRDAEIHPPVLAHEAFHTAVFILSRVGVTLTDDSDEDFAYLIQYLMEEAMAAVR